MTIHLHTPMTTDLPALIDVLATWQRDEGPVQLHPGDIGWFSGRGVDETAAALRVWTHNDAIQCIGLLDGPDVLRLACSPEATTNHQLAEVIAHDLRGESIFAEGEANVEARGFTALTAALTAAGWESGEPWTPFRMALAASIPPTDLTIETVDPTQREEWAATHWSAFRGTPMTTHDRERLVKRLRNMLTGPLGHNCRAILGRDEAGNAVAIAMVWTAGVGGPGLLEPIGVHHDFRGKGYGRMVSVAAASALREMGASSAIVCTETSNTAACAAYTSAGFNADSPVPDMRQAHASSRDSG